MPCAPLNWTNSEINCLSKGALRERRGKTNEMLPKTWDSRDKRCSFLDTWCILGSAIATLKSRLVDETTKFSYLLAVNASRLNCKRDQSPCVYVCILIPTVCLNRWCQCCNEATAVFVHQIKFSFSDEEPQAFRAFNACQMWSKFLRKNRISGRDFLSTNVLKRKINTETWVFACNEKEKGTKKSRSANVSVCDSKEKKEEQKDRQKKRWRTSGALRRSWWRSPTRWRASRISWSSLFWSRPGSSPLPLSPFLSAASTGSGCSVSKSLFCICMPKSEFIHTRDEFQSSPVWTGLHTGAVVIVVVVVVISQPSHECHPSGVFSLWRKRGHFWFRLPVSSFQFHEVRLDTRSYRKMQIRPHPKMGSDWILAFLALESSTVLCEYM